MCHNRFVSAFFPSYFLALYSELHFPHGPVKHIGSELFTQWKRSKAAPLTAAPSGRRTQKKPTHGLCYSNDLNLNELWLVFSTRSGCSKDVHPEPDEESLPLRPLRLHSSQVSVWNLFHFNRCLAGVEGRRKGLSRQPVGEFCAEEAWSWRQPTEENDEIKWTRRLKSWRSPWSNVCKRAQHNTWQCGRPTDDLV